MRTLLAVLAGLVVMMLTVAAIEALGHSLFPPPVGIDFTNPEVLRMVMQTLPVQSLLMVVLGWSLGTFAGAFVAAKAARLYRLSAALAIGIVMVMLIAANLVMVPHPFWMALGGLAMPLPLAWLAWRTATPRAIPAAAIM